MISLARQLLCGHFLLLCPAPPDGLGNTLSPFRGKIPLFLGGFFDGGGYRSFLGSYAGAATKQGARPLQLRDLMIDLCQNLRNSHGSSCYVHLSG